MSTPTTPALTLTGALDAPVTVKELPYVFAEGAKLAPVATGGEVGRGTNRKSGDPFCIHQDGRQQQAIRLQAVAAMVAHEVLTVEEIVALWKSRGVTKQRITDAFSATPS